MQKIFNVLCQSADELNSFNSAMVWFIFTTKTIGFIGSLYIVCSSYSNDDFVLIIIKFLIDIVFFPVIFVAADSAVDEVLNYSLHDRSIVNAFYPSFQVAQLREKIMNIPKRRLASSDDHLQVYLFIFIMYNRDIVLNGDC